MKKATQKKIGEIFGAASNMKYPDIKGACIMLGMDFEDVANADFCSLNSFFAENRHRTNPVQDRLHQYEDWVAGQLLSRGYAADNPLVKYRQFSNQPEEDEQDGKLKTALIKKVGVKPDKPPKKEKTEFGIYSGTKKDFVYKKAKLYRERGYDNERALKRTIRKTMEKFPEAKEKSIRIWFRKVSKELDGASKA